MKKISTLMTSLFVSAMLFSPLMAHATSWGTRAAEMNGEAQQGIPLVGSIIYLIGIIVGAVGMYKFKAYKDDPRSTPLSTPIVYMIVCVGMLYLPSMIKNTGDTVVGAGAQSQGSTGTGLMNIQ